MKLIKCHAENFGTLSSFDYNFTTGLNVINKPNGWGKTTFANFLKAMFYGLEKTRVVSLDDNVRKRYVPWNGGNYGGYVDFEVNGKLYRIERYFGDKESNDTFTLYDLATNKPSQDYTENIGEELFGLNAETFERTAFIPQKALDTTIDDNIKNRLNALLHGTEDDSNFDDARERLSERQSKLKNTKRTGIINRLLEKMAMQKEEIAEIEREISAIGGLKAELVRLEESINTLTEAKKQTDVLCDYSKEYGKLKTEIEGVRLEIQRLTAFFNNADLSYKEIDEMRVAFDNAQSKQELIFDKEQKYEHDQKYEMLREYFASGVPTSIEISGALEKATEIQKLIALKTAAGSQIVKKQNVKLPIILASVGVALIIGGALTTKITALCITLFVLGGLSLLGGGFKYLLDMINFKTQLASSEQFTPVHAEKLETLTTEINAFIGRYETTGGDYQAIIAKIMANVNVFEEVNANHLKIEAEIKELRAEMHDYLDRVYEFLNRYKLPYNLSIPEKFDRLREYRYELDGKRKELAEKEAELQAVVEKMKATVPEGENVNLNAQALLQSQQEYQAAILEAENKKGVISQKIKSLEEKSEWVEELKVEAARTEEEYNDYLIEYKNVSNAIKLLEKSNDAIIARFLSPMKTQLVKYYNALTGSEGDNLFLSTKFSVTFEELGKQREIGYYSKGYKTALALAMRFALIATLFETEKPYVVLDDPFVDLDENKFTSAYGCLKELEKEYQIVYFTCHESRVK